MNPPEKAEQIKFEQVACQNDVPPENGNSYGFSPKTFGEATSSQRACSNLSRPY